MTEGPGSSPRGDAAKAATDAAYMRRCLELARQAEGRVSPNPMVGSVIVGAGGDVLAEGFHRRAGDLHGEAAALEKLGGKAPGATLYTNLEPCSHRENRRTSPCAPMVAAAGIARLVCGIGDPIAEHAGGADWLESQGIEVTRGVLRDECAKLNRAFFTWARKSRPLCVLKAAITADGKIATASGESQWITGKEARARGHKLRDTLDAIAVGVGTVLADDPRLTARTEGGRDPVRVILDSTLKTPPSARVLPATGGSDARTIIACTDAAPAARADALGARGAEIWRLGAGPGGVDVGELCARLAAAEIISVLVEGGPRVHASFIAAGVADEVRLFIAPLIIGGQAAPSWVAGPGAEHLADAVRFEPFGPPDMAGDDLALCFMSRNRAW